MVENNAGFSTAAATNAASGRNDEVYGRAEKQVLRSAQDDNVLSAEQDGNVLRVEQDDDALSAERDGNVLRVEQESELVGATQIVATDRTGATYLIQRDARPWLLVLSLIAVLLDRLSKIYVVKHLQMGQAVTVLPGVFRITHVLNFGAAFSMFAESASPDAVRWSLVVFSVIAAAVVFGLLWRMGRVFSPAAVGLALILGGAIGNLYDRVKLHYVVDFLEVHIVHYHWPDFNVADSCISIGAVLILVELLWAKPKQTHVEDAVVLE